MRIIVCLFYIIMMMNIEVYSNLEKTNLLFIIFDDLRTQLSIYGQNYMKTPNFERLARRSVTFDNAYCQVSVCNPSRDSLLTGLRPDTVGTYSFQWTFRPHMIFPARLGRAGFNTLGLGKVLHWETDDKNAWNFNWDAEWYEYQNKEREYMNSTTMPDRNIPDESFRDYMFVTKAIELLKSLSSQPNNFFLGLGLKLPHLSMHIPYKYYEMYRNHEQYWKLTKKERRFPSTTPLASYRCCAEDSFRYMNQEGAQLSTKSIDIGKDVDFIVPEDMRNELMMGYCGAISFLDVQIGRILDVLDELSLWNNLTIILTSDHGIHNGEKGLWEKWTMFDESTRVPLLIHHPQSPHQGKHFKYPVELLDLFPTINDLTQAPYNKSIVCKMTDPNEIHKCIPLQGKSLAPVVLGDLWEQHHGRHNKRSHNRIKSNEKVIIKANDSNNNTLSSPLLFPDFAITQSWRCATKSDLSENRRANVWFDCSRDDNFNDKGELEVSLMGYSMRTIDFRYTAWIHFNRTAMTAHWDLPPMEEELYDHRGERPQDFTHMELVNVANKPNYSKILQRLRHKLLTYLKQNIVFHGPYPTT